VKSFLSVVMKRPKVQGSEKWGVKCSAVQWCEVAWCESEVTGREVKRSDVKRRDVMWSEVERSEVMGREVNWCGVKWNHGSWSEVMWSEVKWNEGLRRNVLSLTYIYVAVCMFYAVCCVITVGFYLLFNNLFIYLCF